MTNYLVVRHDQLMLTVMGNVLGSISYDLEDSILSFEPSRGLQLIKMPIMVSLWILLL